MRINRTLFLIFIFLCGQAMGMETFLKITNLSNEEINRITINKQENDEVKAARDYVKNTIINADANTLTQDFYTSVNAAFTKIDILAIPSHDSKGEYIITAGQAKIIKTKVFVSLFKLFTEKIRNWRWLWIRKNRAAVINYQDKLITKLILNELKPFISYKEKFMKEDRELAKLYKFRLQAINDTGLYPKHSQLFDNYISIVADFNSILNKLYEPTKIKPLTQTAEVGKYFGENPADLKNEDTNWKEQQKAKIKQRAEGGKYFKIKEDISEEKNLPMDRIKAGTSQPAMAPQAQRELIELKTRISDLLKNATLTGAIKSAEDMERAIHKSKVFWGIAQNLFWITLSVVVIYVLATTDIINQAAPAIQEYASTIINLPSVSATMATLKSANCAGYLSNLQNSEIVTSVVKFMNDKPEEFLQMLKSSQILTSLKNINIVGSMQQYVEYVASIPANVNLFTFKDFAVTKASDFINLIKTAPIAPILSQGATTVWYGMAAIPWKIWAMLGIVFEYRTGIITGTIRKSTSAAQKITSTTVGAAETTIETPVNVTATISSAVIDSAAVVAKLPIKGAAKLASFSTKAVSGSLQLAIMAIAGTVRFSVSIPWKLKNLLSGEIINQCLYARRFIPSATDPYYHDLYTLTSIQANLGYINNFIEPATKTVLLNAPKIAENILKLEIEIKQDSSLKDLEEPLDKLHRYTAAAALSNNYIALRAISEALQLVHEYKNSQFYRYEKGTDEINKKLTFINQLLETQSE